LYSLKRRLDAEDAMVCEWGAVVGVPRCGA
jgi:hypothetical protein